MTELTGGGQNARMLSRYWPLTDLRIRTPRLELRLPDGDDLAALAALAEAGVHDPEFMPFFVPWTDTSPLERGRSVVQWQWRTQADWTPEHWTLTLVVIEGRAVVGTQSVGARNFRLLREFHTGSWLGREYQGRGIGSEMRSAAVHFGFAGLDAASATSAAFEDNAASLGVSRRLGYESDGIVQSIRRGKAATQIRLRLSRSDWERRRRSDITISGLEPCLPLFGVGGEELQNDPG